MVREVRFMSSVKDRENVRHFSAMIENIASRPDEDEITFRIRDIKALMNVVRDFAIMTQISGAEAEAATALACVADYVDQASPYEAQKPTVYKTTSLAEAFGVSVTAINKWIDEGRFIGYQRPEPGKHAKIPHFTPFRLRDGSIMPLGKLIAEYKEKATSFADDDERQLLTIELDRIKKRYGKTTYAEAFGGRELSPSEESDASWWSFYERKLVELNND